MKNEAKEKEERRQRRSKEGSCPRPTREDSRQHPATFQESGKSSAFPALWFFYFHLNGTGIGTLTGSTGLLYPQCDGMYMESGNPCVVPVG
jgi:hypothetical protein